MDLQTARSRKLGAQEALRLSELEMSLCRWQHRLQQMERQLADCELSEARLSDWEGSLIDFALADANAQTADGGAGGIYTPTPHLWMSEHGASAPQRPLHTPCTHCGSGCSSSAAGYSTHATEPRRTHGGCGVPCVRGWRGRERVVAAVAGVLLTARRIPSFE